MTPLPTTFVPDGFEFCQLRRAGQIALFVMARPGSTNQSYEVVIIQQRKEKCFDGRITPAHEALPSPSEWGRLGWTFLGRDFDFAVRKFEALRLGSMTIQDGLTPRRLGRDRQAHSTRVLQ
jgi:hypothetical protein